MVDMTASPSLLPSGNTPRVDAAERFMHSANRSPLGFVLSEVARQLERELAMAMDGAYGKASLQDLEAMQQGVPVKAAPRQAAPKPAFRAVPRPAAAESAPANNDEGAVAPRPRQKVSAEGAGEKNVYEPGQVLFNKGDKADHLAIILEGKVEIFDPSDGKTIASFDYNFNVTREVGNLAHKLGITVEGELGCLGSLETMKGDKEDGHGTDAVMTREQLLTDPEQAADFVKRTQLDALAIAIGTSHGAYKFTRKPTGDILAIDRIQAIHKRIPNTHLVMHGSSSVPQDLLAIIREFGGNMKETYGVPVEEIQKAIKFGVRKVNIDTDIRLAMTGAVSQFLFENPDKFDAREWLKPAREAAKQICKQRYLEFGCEGQAGKIKGIALSVMASQYANGKLAQLVK